MDDWCSHDEDTDEVECEKCEKKFMVQTNVTTQYSSVGDCLANGEMPHELECTFQHETTIYYTCKKCKGDVYDWQLPGGKHPILKAGEFIITKHPKPAQAKGEET